MLFRFSLYGFLKNQRYFEPFLMLVFLDQGFSFFAIGLLIAARDLTVNLLEIPSGAIADSFGRRGAMLISLIAYIVSFLVLGSASDYAWFLTGMVLFGIGDTFRSGTHKAMIFEWLRLEGRTDDRTQVYGYTRSWSQIGSALSGIIAAVFVLLSGSYAFVFYFATVPYVLNLINLASYPAVLNGDHEKAKTVRESILRLRQTLVKSISRRPLRRLMFESMGWEGVFKAVEDYLQPILAALALILLANWATQGQPNTETSNPFAHLNKAQSTALLIGPVYAILHLLSAWASRHAQSLVERSGGVLPASRKLWVANVIAFVVIGVSSTLQLNAGIVLGFVALSVLTNFWRPILVTRFNSESEPQESATILSIESQSRRLATMAIAPLLGGIIDWISANPQEPQLWPIGLLGAMVGLAMWITAVSR